jgi:type I restriction enzyme S subunit
MTQTDLANNPFCFPSLAEQQNIADYLDCKTAKIDSTISSLEAQRDDLNALKQSIISEAVTGKIDVRDWKPNK